MKAIVHHTYGSPEVLRLEEVERPDVGDHEVLVRVRAAAINPFDWHFITGEPYVARVQFGLRRPKTTGVGIDLAGIVDTVGAGVDGWRPGDEVYGGIDEATIAARPDRGTLAEYVCAPAELLVRKPAHLTFDQAAAIPAAGLTALQAVRDWAEVEPGQHVLVNGASGGVGTFAVQIATVFGAEVTGVCSTRNVELVRSLGAHHVIDYTSDDFTAVPDRYDVIIDNVGNRSLRDCRRALHPTGVYVASYGRPDHHWFGPILGLARMTLLSRFVSQRLVSKVSQPNGADLRMLAEMIERGQVRPVVDRTYPLEETVAAMRHLEDGHARGKVVVSV